MLLWSSNLVARLASAILLIPTDVIEQELPMVPPLPKSWKDWQHRHWVDNVMKECWNENNHRTNISGYAIQALDEWLVNGGDWDVSADNHDVPTSFRPSTYGEITPVGARQLFHHMELLPSEKTTPVVFMDWGSGTGKLVAQAYLDIFLLPQNKEESRDLVNRAVGIELSPSRHEAAMEAKSQLLQYLVNNPFTPPVNTDLKVKQAKNKNNDGATSNYRPIHLELLQADLFSEDSVTMEATHVYISSLCFTPDMIQRLEDKLLDHDHRRGKLQWVASLRKFPSLPVTKVEYLEMSWTRPRGIAVYFYSFGNARKSS